MEIKNLMQKNIAIGIDFGTTNSVFSIWDIELNETKVLTNRLGQFTTKSIIGFKVLIINIKNRVKMKF